jgi:hypothetical protein
MYEFDATHPLRRRLEAAAIVAIQRHDEPLADLLGEACDKIADISYDCDSLRIEAQKDTAA